MQRPQTQFLEGHGSAEFTCLEVSSDPEDLD